MISRSLLALTGESALASRARLRLEEMISSTRSARSELEEHRESLMPRAGGPEIPK